MKSTGNRSRSICIDQIFHLPPPVYVSVYLCTWLEEALKEIKLFVRKRNVAVHDGWLTVCSFGSNFSFRCHLSGRRGVSLPSSSNSIVSELSVGHMMKIEVNKITPRWMDDGRMEENCRSKRERKVFQLTSSKSNPRDEVVRRIGGWVLKVTCRSN